MRALLVGVASAWFAAASPLPAQDLAQPFSTIPPKCLHVVVANFFGGSLQVDLHEGVVTCRRTEVDLTSSQKDLRPTPADWEKFVRALNVAKLYAWAPDYENHGVVDGGGWNIHLTIGGHDFYSKGRNEFPKDDAVYMPAKSFHSRPFEIFWQALCQLVREDSQKYPLN